MEKQTLLHTLSTSYKEIQIGKTIYHVTSVFSGEKDLGKTLEQLALRRAMANNQNPFKEITCSTKYESN